MTAGSTLAVQVIWMARLQALVESVKAVACLGRLPATVKVQQQAAALPANMAALSTEACTYMRGGC